MKKTCVASTLNQTETNQGSATLDGVAICLETSSKNWIMLAGDESRICVTQTQIVWKHGRKTA